MKVAWIHDLGNADGTKGGAELTMDEFRAAAPDDVEFVAVDQEPDRVVIGNCATVDPGILEHLTNVPRVVRYWHDLGRAEHDRLREWVIRNATHIFTSPMHAKHHDVEGVWPVIPPAIDLEAFTPPDQNMNGNRTGAVSIGAWQNHGKGQTQLVDWAAMNGPLDVYGIGTMIPMGRNIEWEGPLHPSMVPETLWRYATFVHLPTVIEPFGRCVVEAWAAGCEVHVNALVGARHFIEDDQQALLTAADDFWEVVGVGP